VLVFALKESFMQKEMNDGFTICDLEIQKIGLEDRIKRLEIDIKCPLEADNNEQAMQVSNQIILLRLLEVERSNLRKVNFELEKKKQCYPQ
jgi:hypothetical protein